MLVIALNFILKLSFNKIGVVVFIATTAALCVGMLWPQAILQSKTQISDYLHSPDLMLDTSVILTIEVIINMAYCMLAVRIAADGKLKGRVIWLYRILRWFPGFAIYPVLFSSLVYLIFSLPGHSFPMIAWSFAAVVFVSVVALSLLLRYLLYEKELRLEFLFLTNIFIAILGIVATVNGRTTMVAQNSVDLLSLCAVIIMVLLFAVAGVYLRQIKMKKNIKKQL